MTRKEAPICIGGSEKLRAIDRPRYTAAAFLHLATSPWPSLLGSNRYGACVSLRVSQFHSYIISRIRQDPKVGGGPGVKPGFAGRFGPDEEIRVGFPARVPEGG